jgi:hypothetical protein
MRNLRQMDLHRILLGYHFHASSGRLVGGRNPRRRWPRRRSARDAYAGPLALDQYNATRQVPGIGNLESV